MGGYTVPVFDPHPMIPLGIRDLTLDRTLREMGFADGDKETDRQIAPVET